MPGRSRGAGLPCHQYWYSPTENPAVYQHVYGPLMEHLGRCTGKRMAYRRAIEEYRESQALHAEVCDFPDISTPRRPGIWLH